MKLSTYTIGAVIVWVGILLATAVTLAGTPYFGQLLPILGGGIAWFVVIVPGAWSRPHPTPSAPELPVDEGTMSQTAAKHTPWINPFTGFVIGAALSLVVGAALGDPVLGLVFALLIGAVVVALFMGLSRVSAPHPAGR